ncbi:MAG TPA: hypothetical protein VHC44_02675 [Verrucomicrobiae bacterium]|nr:hypothetical protein [Verrucomicrobiae bacterium]
MTFFTQVVVILILMAGAWWMSGYDSRVTGENKKADAVRRALRCGITFGLLLLTTINPYFAIFIFVTIAILWAGCIAEFFSGQFHRVVDPDDDRKFDPKETERKLDLLAGLVKEGRAAEAIDLCKKLEESGEASALALEATFHHIYQGILDSIEKSPLLREAVWHESRGEFVYAEAELKRILALQPNNWAAMLQLMRVYAKGQSRPDKALAFLQPASKEPQLYPAFVPYAQRSINQWIEEAQNPQASGEEDATPEIQPPIVESELSVDELLKANQLATAVERLEKEISEQPKNFELRLKLAEAYAVYCADPNRAGKIIQKMENAAAFSAEQIQLAKAKLREWQKAKRS